MRGHSMLYSKSLEFQQCRDSVNIDELVANVDEEQIEERCTVTYTMEE